MKTIKSKIVAGVTAFMLLFGTFFLVKAIGHNEIPVSPSKTAAVPFYYTGPATTNMAILQDLDNWSTSQDPTHECGGTANVPCSIPAESETDLNSKLQACSNINDVLSEATARRQNK